MNAHAKDRPTPSPLLSLYAPLFLAGLVGLWMKLQLIKDNALAICRLLEIDALDARLTLSLVASDILANLFIVPCALLLALKLLRLATARLCAALGCLLALFYFIQLQAQQSLGQYMSYIMLYEAIHFGLASKAVALSYMKPAAMLKLGIALGAVVLSAECLRRAEAHPALRRPLAIATRAIAVALALALALATTLYALPQHNTGIYRSAAQRALESFIPDTPPPLGAGDASATLDALHQLTHTPPAPATPATLAGSARGANLLYFVMETGAADAIAPGILLDKLPAALRQHALVADDHHTTYPYTSDALFSILSGFYPQGRRELIERGGFQQRDGLLWQLRARGYTTGAYQPALFDTGIDDAMFKQLGIEHFFTTTRDSSAASQREASTRARALAGELLQRSPHFPREKRDHLEKMLTNDLNALSHMEQDMRAAHAAGKPFAFLFLPQIGHAPWLPIGPERDRLAHGRELILLQMSWLNGIVELLRQQGRLENTVIVFTGDHGMRTRVEDPSLPIGTLSSRAFRVPLVLYAPGISGTEHIAEATSHIDIAPTLAALYGATPQAMRTEGAPLWAADASRRLYLSARGYGGAEGYREQGYYMHNLLTDQVLASPTLDFSPRRGRPATAEEHAQVTQALDDFRQLHSTLLQRL